MNNVLHREGNAAVARLQRAVISEAMTALFLRAVAQARLIE
jgi:hypothetical protein